MNDELPVKRWTATRKSALGRGSRPGHGEWRSHPTPRGTRGCAPADIRAKKISAPARHKIWVEGSHLACGPSR